MFEWFPDGIASVQASAAGSEAGWKFTLNPPATEGDLHKCEADLRIAMPPSYRAFLLRWNGASLFRQEVQMRDGTFEMTAEFGIAGTGRLTSLNNGLRAALSPYTPTVDWGGLVVYCDLPGGGAFYCGLNPERSTAEGEYAVVDCHEDFGPRCWRRAVIAPSFEMWLQRAFDSALRNGDPYYWPNTPEVRAIYRQCHEEDQREAAERRQRQATG